MVGSPFQTPEMLVAGFGLYSAISSRRWLESDPLSRIMIRRLRRILQVRCNCTLRLLAIVRLMLPNVLLPSTTALGTIHPNGRELGLRAGANVVMPNLSPVEVRKLYELYDDKICTGEEAARVQRLPGAAGGVRRLSGWLYARGRF